MARFLHLFPCLALLPLIGCEMPAPPSHPPSAAVEWSNTGNAPILLHQTGQEATGSTGSSASSISGSGSTANGFGSLGNAGSGSSGTATDSGLQTTGSASGTATAGGGVSNGTPSLRLVTTNTLSATVVPVQDQTTGAIASLMMQPSSGNLSVTITSIGNLSVAKFHFNYTLLASQSPPPTPLLPSGAPTPASTVPSIDLGPTPTLPPGATLGVGTPPPDANATTTSPGQIKTSFKDFAPADLGWPATFSAGQSQPLSIPLDTTALRTMLLDDPSATQIQLAVTFIDGNSNPINAVGGAPFSIDVILQTL